MIYSILQEVLMRYSNFEKNPPRDPEKSKKQRRKIITWTVIIFFIAAIYVAGYIIFTTEETRDSRALRIERERTKFWNSITHEDILYDIDYMLYVLEHNFPFLDSIYDRYGVDMLELGKELRVIFEDDAFNPDIHDFITIVDNFLLQAHRTGHLRVWSRDRFAHSSTWRENADITPQTLEFYGEVDRIDAMEAHPFRDIPYIIRADTIEEDRIGYMQIRNFYPLQGNDYDIIRPFFEEIVDFEHLIIDLRDNSGGYANTLFYIMSPLMKRTARATFHLFFPQEELIFAHIKSEGLDRESTHIRIKDYYDPVAESRIRRTLVGVSRDEADWMRELHTESEYFITFEILGYLRARTTLQTDFDGQIWLLTDGDTYSAAEWMTAIMGMSDAIIVGERTGGVFGVPSIWPVVFALPNTGMLIEFDFTHVYDRHGRPLSDGIDPNHWIRPGMDALETTLALINEGAYR